MTTERGATRRPLHLGVLLGMSAATYATALASVAAIQSSTDLATLDERQPAIDAITTLGRHNDELAARIDRAATRYDAVAGTYAPLVDDVASLEAAIDKLAGTVAGIGRTSASLPTRVSIPRSVRAAPAAPRPASHATTGASGAP